MAQCEGLIGREDHRRLGAPALGVEKLRMMASGDSQATMISLLFLLGNAERGVWPAKAKMVVLEGAVNW